MTDTVIRTATSADVPQILALIKALAVYEKEPDAVDTTEADLLRDGFGETPHFHCLIAETETTPVGFALYFFKWSTWTGRPTLHLEDLFVKPDHRGTGAGMKLFKKLAGIAVEKQCQRLEWEVLDWNHTARDFYHQLGAYHRRGWYPYRIEGDALRGLAAPKEKN